MDKYKKSLIIMWSAMGTAVIACIAFLTVGILLLQYQAGLKAEVCFTVTEGKNEYLLSDGETLELELACKQGESATVKAKADYIVGEIKHDTFTVDFPVPLSSPQTYELSHKFTYENKETTVKINVKVIDPTPAPVLKLVDDGSYEFEAERRYVYRYDGTKKYPKELEAYDDEGKYIGRFSTEGCIKNVARLEGESVFVDVDLINVGKYKCDVILTDYGRQDKNYKPSGIYGLIIEIIE